MNRIFPGLPAALLAALVACFPGADCLAWGRAGHEAIGLLALLRVDASTLRELERINGTGDLETMAEACNWPDSYRETAEGAWSEPQHYVNLPPGTSQYEPGRDCPNGRCVAGAIVRYAAELGDRGLPKDQREKAWARVCHFVADVHQPLHAGYGADKGGNDIRIIFNGEEMTLHHFWDHALFDFNYPDKYEFARDLSVRVPEPPASQWTPGDVNAWVEESHRLVESTVYPDGKEINREFAAANWLLALDQMAKASARLAQVLNTALATE